MLVFQELNSNGSGYLVGGSATIADVALLELVLSVQDYFGEAALESYPGIKVRNLQQQIWQQDWCEHAPSPGVFSWVWAHMSGGTPF